MFYDFIKQLLKFQGCRIIEKCDDGFSGKCFDRPAFTELIDLAKKGRIDCIIVKDLSRFGRDYIELGDYLEQLFLFLGIRFIAVNDHYDSKDGGQETSGLEVAFKNFTAEILPKRSVMSERRWWSPDSLQVLMCRMVIRSLQRTSISWWLMKRRHRLSGRFFR